MEDEEVDAVQRELIKNQEAADAKLAAVLNTIFKKSIGELNSDNKEFLYARRDILTREQRDNYRGVFKEVEGWHKVKLAKEAAEQKTPTVEPEVEFSNPHPGESEDDGEDEAQG